MYTDDVINKLNKHRIRFGNCDYFIATKVEDELNNLAKQCVRWSIDDFKGVALQKKGNDWNDWYDEDLFEEALFAMINKHDAMIGINWETVNCYLEEYCRKKYDPIK